MCREICEPSGPGLEAISTIRSDIEDEMTYSISLLLTIYLSVYSFYE